MRPSGLNLLTMATLLSLTQPGYAEVTQRKEHQEAYKTQLRKTPAIFSGAPVYHLVPRENTVTIAASVERTDVTVGSPGSHVTSANPKDSQRLYYEGWSGSPYLAFSGKNFGIGAAGTVGQAASTFTYAREENLAEKSSLRYSGIGMFLYATARPQFLPKNVNVTIFGGASSLYAIQTEEGSNNPGFYQYPAQRYRYAVQRYTGGLDIGIQLAKRFTWIPWIDYARNRAGNPTASDTQAIQRTISDNALADNQNLYWGITPPLRYGVDFAAQLFGLDIHFGGLLGALGSINKGSDRVLDNSNEFSISLSTASR